jgi:cellulose biosynthesis protein BcsQ
MASPIILTIAMQQGGVGKTSLAVTACDGLRRDGFKCCLIDLDPQASASSLLNPAGEGTRQPSVKDLLIDPDCQFEDCIIPGLTTRS